MFFNEEREGDKRGAVHVGHTTAALGERWRRYSRALGAQGQATQGRHFRAGRSNPEVQGDFFFASCVGATLGITMETLMGEEGDLVLNPE